jgi:hypothetical protein
MNTGESKMGINDEAAENKRQKEIREDLNLEYFSVNEKMGSVKVTGAAAAFAARMARKATF